MEIIKLSQKPVLDFTQLKVVAARVDEKLSQYNFDLIVVDEESVKGVKKLRAELNNEFKELEESRKEIKKAILAPYDEFEKNYSDLISSKYKDADSKLKKAVDDIENGIKKEKENQIRAYFEEYSKSKNIDFATFEQSNIKVGLSDSVKSLQEQAKQFVDNIEKDIETIAVQQHSTRILVRYRTTLDVRNAIQTVLREVEVEKQLTKVEEPVKVEEKPVVEIVEVTEPEEILTLSFKVSGTKRQLLNLREWMKKEGIKYE